MKTLKHISGWVLFFLFAACVAEIGSAFGSGISGLPANPAFGTVTINQTTAMAAASNGIDGSGGGMTIHAATNSCINFKNGSTFVASIACGTNGGQAPIFTGIAAQNVVGGGKMYAFMLTTNGSTCAVASGSPAFPAGWSAANPSTGVCVITHPSVTNANSMIPVVTAGTGETAAAGGGTTTTIQVTTYTAGTATAANGTFFIYLQDWN